jgi:hypothetical protein
MKQGSPKKYSVYAPMAIAAIGSLPMPLLRRSIIIHMEKTAGVAHLKRFEPGDAATKQQLDTVYGFVRRWVNGQDWSGAKPNFNLDPSLPKDLKNRAADNWRVLIAIADCFGPAWSQLAREPPSLSLIATMTKTSASIYCPTFAISSTGLPLIAWPAST